MKKILILTVLLSTMLLGSIGASANTGWTQKEDGNLTYTASNGVTAKDGIAQIDGDLYYFDSLGNRVSGWVNWGDKWLYFNNSGVMVTGWANLEGNWYYFTNSGIMTTGECNLDGTIYNFGTDGKLIW